MNKEELVRIFEKTRPQTRGQAIRVIDLLVGVRSDPFAKKTQDKRILQKDLSTGTDKEFEDKLDKG